MNWKLLAGFTVLTWALSNFLIKAISVNIDWRLHFAIWVLGTASVVTIYAIVTKKNAVKPPKQITGSMIAGLMCSFGTITAAIALGLQDGSKIMPIIGTATPLSAIASLILFKEKFTWKIEFGILFVVIGLFLLSK